jgi:acetyl-CoA acetyltransferase
MSDGAAFVLVMSEEMVKELNLEPGCKISKLASAGLNLEYRELTLQKQHQFTGTSRVIPLMISA